KMSAADELAMLDADTDDMPPPVVPSKAQTSEPAKPEAPEPPKAAKAEPPKEKRDGLFESDIDQDLDDIFSNLVPVEAQPEVSQSEPAAKEEPPAPAPETKSEAKKEEEKPAEKPKSPEPVNKEPASEGLFGGGLDQELDDIFSNLAPSEAL